MLLSEALIATALRFPRPNAETLRDLQSFLVAGGDPDAHVEHGGRRMRLLTACAQGGWIDGVNVLLDHDADVHADADRALCRAAENGHLPVVERLLAAGADVHADNAAALRWASWGGHVHVVERLLAAGADVHAAHDRALAFALYPIPRPDVVRILLRHGADIVIMWNQLKQHDKSHVATVLDGMVAEIPVDQRRILIEQSPHLFPALCAMHAAARRCAAPAVAGKQKRKQRGRGAPH